MKKIKHITRILDNYVFYICVIFKKKNFFNVFLLNWYNGIFSVSRKQWYDDDDAWHWHRLRFWATYHSKQTNLVEVDLLRPLRAAAPRENLALHQTCSLSRYFCFTIYASPLQDDHRGFRRQLEDKRPVVENNLLSGRQYIANEPPLSDTSDSEGT